jgi:hypothetical protein
MSDDDRRRDIREAIHSLVKARTERRCLESRLTKFASQMEAVAEILRRGGLTMADGKIVKYGAVAEGELVYPDRQALCEAIEQYDVACKKHGDARQRCSYALGLSDLVERSS